MSRFSLSANALCTVLSLILLIATLTVDEARSQLENRDSWQQPTAIMDSIGVLPGMSIGEGGAGEGYFTFYLSRRVGPAGKVYANDIDSNALRKINERTKQEGITNIVTIVGQVDDPLFPQNLDLVIIMNAFHEFEEPVDWMRNILPSMKRGALLVIIDRDPEKSLTSHGHFMNREKVLATMARTDFALVRVLTFLDWDNIYMFRIKNLRGGTSPEGEKR